MLEIKMKTSNAALRMDDGKIDMNVVATMLRNIADSIEDGLENGCIMDINGNNFGNWKVRIKYE